MKVKNKSFDFPNFVWNNPIWKNILIRIFKYNAPFYDLEKYDEIDPGSGKKLWDKIQSEFNKERKALVHGNVAFEGC